MATWFAQNSGVNIDSVNQWNSAANGSGSWLTWASLDASDVLVANGKTSITINVNTTCTRLTTAATGGTAGGGFILASGITLTAAVEGISTTCVTLSSGSAAIVGNITTAVFAGAVLVTSTGTLTVTGNVTAGFGNAVGITVTSTGTVNVTGNVTGGATQNTFGISNSSTGTVNVTGNVTGGNAFQSHGIYNASTGTVVITGNCYAGTSAGAYAAANNVSAGGTIVVTGDVYPSTATNALVNAVSSGVSLGRITVFGNIFSAVTGYAGVGTGLFTVSPTIEFSHSYRTQSGAGIGAARTIYTGGTNIGQPVAANVRSGTTFGAAAEYTGTLAVPSPTLVAIGVPTDDTVGSYNPSVNASDIRSAVGLASANLDTQLSGIQSDTNDIQTRLPAALESGRIAAVLDSASVTAVADQVWDEAYADHNSAGSFGKLLNTIRKSNLAIEGVVTNAVSPTATSFTSNVSATTGAYEHAVLLFTSGSLAGENSPIITYTNANGSIVLEEALTSAPSVNDEFVIIAGSHVHSVSSIKSGLSTLTAANVNAEVVDALSVDTYAELTAPPAATSSLKDKITWLFMYARNKVTQTALERKLYRDDTTTVAGTSATSDDGATFTKGEDA